VGSNENDGCLEDSFETTYLAVLTTAFAVAYRILGHVPDAEDAAAEAFARALASWQRVARLPYREAWILRVTANVAIDRARRERLRPEIGPPATSQNEDLTAVRVALVAALRSLPHRQRDAVVLRYLAGLPEREVAACLHLSPNTVKTHTHRGLEALRRLLRDDQEVPNALT
jgi:RNA polymerase sigma factor (sigma-70 family)